MEYVYEENSQDQCIIGNLGKFIDFPEDIEHLDGRKVSKIVHCPSTPYGKFHEFVVFFTNGSYESFSEDGSKNLSEGPNFCLASKKDKFVLGWRRPVINHRSGILITPPVAYETKTEFMDHYADHDSYEFGEWEQVKIKIIRKEN